MANIIAPDGEIWVCLACGKTSKDRYGLEEEHSPGWDESCMLNSRMVSKDRLVFSKSGLTVIDIKKE